MEVPEYEAELLALGITGPVGDLQQNGVAQLVYRMFDGSQKFLLPPDLMTPAERAEVIVMLKRHLGVVHEQRMERAHAAAPFGTPRNPIERC